MVFIPVLFSDEDTTLFHDLSIPGLGWVKQSGHQLSLLSSQDSLLLPVVKEHVYKPNVSVQPAFTFLILIGQYGGHIALVPGHPSECSVYPPAFAILTTTGLAGITQAESIHTTQPGEPSNLTPSTVLGLPGLVESGRLQTDAAR